MLRKEKKVKTKKMLRKEATEKNKAITKEMLRDEATEKKKKNEN